MGAPPTDPTTPPGATTPATEPAPAPTELAADDAATRARVDALLSRYDDLVTRLAADPVAALDPMHPARAEWNTLVPIDTALSADVLEQLVVGPAAEGTRLVPGADGRSYRHRSLSVGPPADDMIEFTWCGYSPGVRVDSSSGRVVDDAVAHVHGSGRLLLDAGGWVIDALDHLSIEVHAPGSGDPCPAEQAALSGGDAP